MEGAKKSNNKKSTNNNKEGTMPTIINMEGTPPLRGVPYPVFKCGQYV